MQKRAKGATKARKCCEMISEFFGIRVVYDLDRGIFPCHNDEGYRDDLHSKRMLFYVLFDLPLLCIKVLNNMYTGNTFILAQCFSLVMQLLGLFSSIFNVREITARGEGCVSKNVFQKTWCLLLWVCLIWLQSFLLFTFFENQDERPDWVKSIVSDLYDEL